MREGEAWHTPEGELEFKELMFLSPPHDRVREPKKFLSNNFSTFWFFNWFVAGYKRNLLHLGANAFPLGIKNSGENVKNWGEKQK